MCNPVAIIGGALTAISSMAGGSKGVESYTPEQKNLTVEPPAPGPTEPAFGVDNTNDAAKQAQKGRNSLKVNYNPGVAATGNSSGVQVPAG